MNQFSCDAVVGEGGRGNQVGLTIHPSINQSINLFIYLSLGVIGMNQFLCDAVVGLGGRVNQVCLSICPSIYLSIHPSIHLPIWVIGVNQFLCDAVFGVGGRGYQVFLLRRSWLCPLRCLRRVDRSVLPHNTGTHFKE